jgi:4-methyl-5(b-hydroxyethyl)-thiazole monophosphate biosynthesis
MKKVLTILATGFEETEAVAVIDLLRRAEIEVTICGLGDKIVTGSHEITIHCDTMISDVAVDDFDCLFLPGGQPGTNNLKNDPQVINLIRQFDISKKWITAICAAPTVFQAAGILSGKKVTSYPAERESFTDSVYLEENVVRDGKIITSRGVGTAIEFALYLIGVLKDHETRKMLADRILYFEH